MSSGAVSATARGRLLTDRSLLLDIVQWDVATWQRPVVFWDDAIDWAGIHECLELGAGKGGLSLWLALKGKQVTCSDRDPLNLVEARGHHAAHYHVAGRIEYQLADAVELPYVAQYDLIVFKSVLGGIRIPCSFAIQKQAMERIHRALRPNGKLLFAENLTATPVHQFFRQKCMVRTHTWRYVTISEMSELLCVFSRVETHTAGVLATFGRTESQRSTLAAADALLLERVCPAAWRYMAYGVAVK